MATAVIQVINTVRFLCEPFSTFSTLERFLTSVNFHMGYGGRLAGKTFPALYALVRLLSRVCVHVPGEVNLLRKAFHAR